MGERKVISKYYPPDFDPSKIPRAKGVKKSGTIKVVMMLPMSIRCNTCGEYIGRGTKFNSRKETVEGEDYLGLKIFRFYLRCKKCAAELAIRTDPQNSEYICESGATRNYEPWKETDEEKAERQTKEEEEDGDAMKALENRTIDSKREMEMMDALDELRVLNARNSDIDPEQLLEYSMRRQEELEKRNALDLTTSLISCGAMTPAIAAMIRQLLWSLNIRLQPRTCVVSDRLLRNDEGAQN
eukprot:gene9725-11355_t